MAITTAAMAEHVAAFVRIVNASQSKELHEWTLESLQRSFAWANVMEKLAEKVTNDGLEATRDLEGTLAKHLHGAALPSPLARSDGISVDLLKNATHRLCDAVLTSPWLHAHPRRSDLTTLVFKKLIERSCVSSGNSLASHRELFIQQLQVRQLRESMGKVANTACRGLKRTRVQVHSVAFEIPSLASYQLQHRTLQLKSLARTLQANACTVNSLSESQHASGNGSLHDYLTRVEGQLRRSDKDVVETVVWSVAIDWSSDHTSVRTEMIKTIEAWLLSQPPSQLFILEPWLAAMFASHSQAFASQYLQVLLSSGLRLSDRQGLRTRIGALVLQDATLQAAVEARVGQLDLVTREQLLSYIVE